MTQPSTRTLSSCRGTAMLTAGSAAAGLWASLRWGLMYGCALGIFLAWFTAPVWLSLPTSWIVPLLVFYLGAPLGAATGRWRYLSGFLTLHGDPRSRLALHLGTTYDVFWRLLPRRRPPERLFQTMHRELYAGLCAFCDELAEGSIPGAAPVIACSYFLTPKQMARYGFAETKASPLTRACFIVGYPEVILQQLLITGRLRLYNPLAIRCYQSTAAEIARRRSYFARLAEKSGAEV